MALQNPLTSPIIPKFHEASRQRSGRDSDAVQRAWIREQKFGAQIRSLNNAVAMANSEFGRNRIVSPDSERIHGFSIYQVPDFYRSSFSADDWLNFHVRSGLIGNSVRVTAGCDNCNSSYIENPFWADSPGVGHTVAIPTTGVGDEDWLTLTDAQWQAKYSPTGTNPLQWYFWIELNDDWAENGVDSNTAVYSSDDPSTYDASNHTIWTSFPDEDAFHILIGWVYFSERYRPEIRQVLGGDLPPQVEIAVCDSEENLQYIRVYGTQPYEHAV